MRFAILAVCFAVLATPGAATELNVTGQGEVAAVPDMAVISLQVEAQARTARGATQAMSADARRVLDGLADLGLEGRDVQTGQLSLNPVYDHSDRVGGPMITGYRAGTSIDLRVLDLDALGAVLDQVVAEGATGFRGLRFALQDPRPAEDEARRAAFADAMAKAELYADAAGLQIIEITRISEGGGMRPPMPMMEAAMARSMDAVPVAAGEVTTAITVSLVVELGPKP